MPEEYVLLAVVAAIYLFDCARWWRADVVVLRSWAGHEFQTARPGAQLGNASGGFVWGNPVPPLGTVVGCGLWPLSFGSAGVLGFTFQTTPGQSSPPATHRFVPWERLATLEREERRLLIDEEPLVNLPSKRAAIFWGRHLVRLATLSSSERTFALDELLRSTLDDEAAKRRAEALFAAVRPLRVLCNLLLVYMIVAIYMLIEHETARLSWPLWLAGLFAGTLLTTVFFLLAAGKLRTPGEGLPWTHALVTLIAPLSTVRAVDAVAADAFAEFHPAAVARRLMPRHEFVDFLRAMILDLRHPLLPRVHAGDADPRSWPSQHLETEAASRARQLDLLEGVVEELGMSVDDVLAPPVPESHDVRSYCPRCRQQFAGAEGECPSCPGIRRVPAHSERSIREVN